MVMPGTAERWTAAEVRALPDDGNRYELIDGELLVTPAPRGVHQIALAALFRRLDRAGGPGKVVWSPADISLGEDEILQPDLFVCLTAGSGPLIEWTDITGLLLVIEVLSPSTARYDREVKRRRYQRAGVPEYWVVDTAARRIERWRPEDAHPEVLADRIRWEGVDIDLHELFTEIWGR